MSGENGGIDNDYLNSIAELDDGGGVDTSTNTDNSGGDDDGHDQQQQQQQQSPNQQSGVEDQSRQTQATQGGNADDTQTQQKEGQQQQQAQQTPTAPNLRRHAGGDFVNERGDIVNARGEVIAPQGAARRLHERNVRLQRDMTSLQRDLAERDHALQTVQMLNGIPQQYGMSQQEVAQALDLGIRIKRGDALGVAKDVIAMLAAKGHNISELVGNNVGDAIDMRAIRQMLDERLAPISQQQEQQQLETERTNAARRNYETFVRNNEYADVHGNEIVALMKRNSVNQQQAYNMLREFVVKNNLDISQPLGPQIEARMTQMRQTQQSQQRQSTNNSRPMPNGAQTRNDGVREQAPVYADPDDSWGEIIHEAMRAAAQ